MASKKIDPSRIWDDESGEPAPFTPDDVDARLNVAMDRMEQENEAMVARQRELEELLTREEAIVASLHTAVADSFREMREIASRMRMLMPNGQTPSRHQRSNPTRKPQPSTAP